MRLHRFLYPLKNPDTKFLKISEIKFVHQIRDVLKIKIGEQVIIVDGKGEELTASVSSYGKDFVECEVISRGKNKNEPKIDVWLFSSILKGEHFDLLAQKAVEVGVSGLVPFVSSRTVKKDVNRARIRKIMSEAVEQSERGHFPELWEVITFDKAVKKAKEFDCVFFCERGSKKIISEIKAKGKRLAIFVGPEGGWSDAEISLAKNKKFDFVSLGPFNLRAETAGVVAVHNALMKIISDDKK